MLTKNYFFITTNGHTASKWIAKSLSSHNDIICSHGAANLDISLIHHREYTDDEKKAQMTQEYRKKVPVDILLKEIEKYAPEKKIIGNIHMFNLRQLMTNFENNNSTKKIAVVDVIRHPVSFVNSGYYNIYSQCMFNPNRIDYLNNVKKINIELYESFSEKYKLDLSDIKVLSFLSNVMTFYSFKINFNFKKIKRYKMEDLTSSTIYFEDLINYISNNSINVSEFYLKNITSSTKENSHVPSSKTLNEIEKFKEWEKWKQDVFIEMLYKTDCKKEFENLGYDLTFV